MKACEIVKTLWFNDFVFEGNNIFFASGSFNGLFCADFKSGASNFLDFFPCEDMFGHHLFCGTYKYENRILFIPALGKQFFVYDMLNKSFESIALEERYKMGSTQLYKYYGSIQVGKYVYIFGYLFPEILRINIQTSEIKFYEGWLEELCTLGEQEKNPFFYKDVCAVENSLYTVTGQNNSIIELDMKTDRILIHPIGQRGSIYDTIAYDGECFWLTEQAKRIIRVDRENWKIQNKEIQDRNTAKHFLASTVMHGEILLFPDRLGNILKIRSKDFRIQELSISYGSADIWYPNHDAHNFYFVKQFTEDKLAFLCAQDCQIHIWDQKGESGRIKFLWENAVMDYYNKLYNIFNELKIAELMRHDTPSYILQNFIYYVKHSDSINQATEKNLNNGNVIYMCIRDMWSSFDA